MGTDRGMAHVPTPALPRCPHPRELYALLWWGSEHLPEPDPPRPPPPQERDRGLPDEDEDDWDSEDWEKRPAPIQE